MPPSHPAHPQCQGWTLVELGVVLATLALLCALAFPALHTALEQLRADTLRMRIVSVFNSARLTAITRHRPIQVCPSTDGLRCGDDWGAGWLTQAQDPALVAALDDPLHFQAGMDQGTVRVFAGEGRKRLHFQADGRSGGSNLTVHICIEDRLHSQVIVNNVGRTRSTRLPDAAPCPN